MSDESFAVQLAFMRRIAPEIIRREFQAIVADFKLDVCDAAITDTGELTISLSNGKTLNCGRARGQDGVSVVGKRGLRGQRGQRGVGIDTIITNEDNVVQVHLTDGTVRSFQIKVPGPIEVQVPQPNVEQISISEIVNSTELQDIASQLIDRSMAGIQQRVAAFVEDHSKALEKTENDLDFKISDTTSRMNAMFLEAVDAVQRSVDSKATILQKVFEEASDQQSSNTRTFFTGLTDRLAVDAATLQQKMVDLGAMFDSKIAEVDKQVETFARDFAKDFGVEYREAYEAIKADIVALARTVQENDCTLAVSTLDEQLKAVVAQVTGFATTISQQDEFFKTINTVFEEYSDRFKAIVADDQKILSSLRNKVDVHAQAISELDGKTDQNGRIIKNIEQVLNEFKAEVSKVIKSHGVAQSELAATVVQDTDSIKSAVRTLEQQIESIKSTITSLSVETSLRSTVETKWLERQEEFDRKLSSLFTVDQQLERTRDVRYNSLKETCDGLIQQVQALRDDAAKLVAEHAKEFDKVLTGFVQDVVPKLLEHKFSIEEGILVVDVNGRRDVVGRVVGDTGPGVYDLQIDPSTGELFGLVGSVAQGIKHQVIGRVVGDKGEKGDPGEPGLPGEKGEPGVGVKEFILDEAGVLYAALTNGAVETLGKVTGPKGDAGRSVSGARIDADGKLVLNFSDGSSTSVGKVVGANGKSIKGSKGDKGDSIKGDPGKDGAPAPGFMFSGEWQPRTYFGQKDNPAGPYADVVVYKKSCYICVESTSLAPPSKGWVETLLPPMFAAPQNSGELE